LAEGQDGFGIPRNVEHVLDAAARVERRGEARHRSHTGAAGRGGRRDLGFLVRHDLQNCEAGSQRHDTAQFPDAQVLQRLAHLPAKVGERHRTQQPSAAGRGIDGDLSREGHEVGAGGKLVEHTPGRVGRLDNDDAKHDSAFGRRHRALRL
jgi:hypothetical protein